MCYIDNFIDYKKVSDRGIKGGTIPKYKQELNKFFTYFKENKNIETQDELVKDITPIDMDEFKNWMIESNYAISTINGVLMTVSQFSKYLLNRNITKDDFCKGIKEISLKSKNKKFKPVKKKDVILKEDFEGLIKQALTRQKGERGFEFNSIRNTFIILLMASTGMRIGDDVLDIKLQQIKIINGTPFIFRQEEDTKCEIAKSVPIVGKCLEYYNKYIKLRNNLKKINDKDYLILSDKGNKLHKQNVYEFLVKYSNRLNIDKKFSAHCFRHLFSAVGNSLGINHAVLNAIGGWSNDTNMQDYYAKDGITQEAKIDACKRILKYLIDERHFKGFKNN